MPGLNFGLDFLIIAAVAITGGLLARRAHLPAVLGYIAGGIAIGPYGFAVINDPSTVDTFSTLGVILLLFTVGLEFPIREFIHLGRITIFGALTQIFVTVGASLLLGLWLGTGWTGAVFLGFLIAFSSTMIVLKILTERGELDSGHGRILIGILLVQDFAVVPLMIIVPLLNGGGGETLLLTFGIVALKIVLFIALTIVLGIWVVPWVFRRVANERFRELFLLTVIILVLASAFGTYYLGFSFTLGGYVAGLLIGQSIFARQAIADVVPLRDAFVALFFVALGMLFDPHFMIGNPQVVVIFVVIVMAGKFIIGFAIPWVAGRHLKTALFVGIGLIPIGEFSFVLAGIGLQAGIISAHVYSIVLAGAIVTLLLSPFSFDLVAWLYRQFNQSNRFKTFMARRALKEAQVKSLNLAGHVVICGFGKVGSTLAGVLDRRKFPYLAIDLDPNVVAALRARSVPCIYGDSSNPRILAQAQLGKARVLVCAFNDALATELTVRNAHNVNANLHIITRANRDADIALIRKYGASEIVQPEFEAGLEIVRYTLRRYGLNATEIQYILSGLRTGVREP